MGLLVCLTLSFAAFLCLEIKVGQQELHRQQSKLNAWMSARLALAHLQQTAGPDQRSTATALLAGGFDPQDPANLGVAHWTGVWRTDFPDEPPYWLVSGNFTSLAGKADYEQNTLTPWQHPPLHNETFVVNRDGVTLDTATHRIDGRVALPKIILREFPDEFITGAIAYWIGDEGVKTRVNLIDDRLNISSSELTTAKLQALRSPHRYGTELLLGLKNIPANDPRLAVLTPASLKLISSHASTNFTEDIITEPDFHHQTCWSAGLQTDSFRGGLKRDLSLAFEMDDADFDASEFGSGWNLPSEVTESYTTNFSKKTRRSWFPPYAVNSASPYAKTWVPMHENNPDNPGRNLGNQGERYLAWSPVFIREDEMGQPFVDTTKQPPITTLATSPQHTPRRFVGPLWHLLRDYYRLYKEIDWTDTGPRLAARSFFPNTSQFLSGGYRPALSRNPYSLYDHDHALWSNGGSTITPHTDAQGDTPDPLGWPHGLKENHYLPRPVRGAYLPTLHRISLAFTIKQQPVGKNFCLQATCTPWVVLHNPYNVKLALNSANKPEPDLRVQGYALRLALADWTNVALKLQSHKNNNISEALTDFTGIRLPDLFSLQPSSNIAHAENLSLLIPTIELLPGEHVVFSAQQYLPATSLGDATREDTRPLLKLAPGFTPQGGITADLVTHALTVLGNPDNRTRRLLRLFAPDDSIQAWLSVAETSWHQTIFLISGWKQNLRNDQLNPVASALSADEVLGSNRLNSTASQGPMINLGTFNTAPGSFFGHAGDETCPLNLGAVQNLPQAGSYQPGALVGLIETRIRLADTQRTTTYHRPSLSWQAAQQAPTPAPNPLWLFSNPLAPSSTTPAQNSIPAIGSPSLRTQVYGGDEWGLHRGDGDWSQLMATNPINPIQAYGGFTHKSTGVLLNPEIEIPLCPPVSIGQFVHANLSPWDWFPYRTVGNSFPNLVCPLDKTWTHSTPAYAGGHTFADFNYLLNNALWDHFFFSGACPDLSLNKTGDYLTVKTVSTEERVEQWLSGQGVLANPNHRYLAATKPSQVLNPTSYQQIAGWILNDGAFNVNSVSVEAWEGFYGALKNLPLGQYPYNAPSASGNARLPRVLTTGSLPFTNNQFTDASYWAGWKNLSDAQITALAAATVEEIKVRTSYLMRQERDQEFPPTARRFRGFPTQEIPHTPFLSLSEFINRFLGPTKKIGAQVHNSPTYNRSFYPLENTAAPFPRLPAPAEKAKWMFQSGTLESALTRADQTLGNETLAGIPAQGSAIDPSISHNWQYLETNGQRSGMPPGSYFRNLAILNPQGQNRTHNGFGASGCLFQGDLLQALGSRIATRSDTFRMRAYGESNEGNLGHMLEWIIQRTPDFVDPQDPAATSPHQLNPLNQVLGRRFKVISSRWLAPSEI
jgi:hypothetical protein